MFISVLKSGLYIYLGFPKHKGLKKERLNLFYHVYEFLLIIIKQDINQVIQNLLLCYFLSRYFSTVESVTLKTSEASSFH